MKAGSKILLKSITYMANGSLLKSMMNGEAVLTDGLMFRAKIYSK